MKRIAANRYQKWMSIKYYLLCADRCHLYVASGGAGSIPFLVRSLATSVVPAINVGIRETSFLHSSNIGVLQSLADAGYLVLAPAF